MASIRRRGTSYRVELCKDRKRESATFPTRQQATAWAQQREAELGGERLPDHTVGEALRKFAREVSPGRKGARWEKLRCGLLGRDKLADVRLPSLRPIHLAEWRERRLQAVSGVSVRREMALLAAVLRKCRKEWCWMAADPLADVDKPPARPPRRRRIPQDEIDRLTLALGYDGGPPETAQHRVALAFLFAVETAMRSGELLGLTWADVHGRKAVLPDTKNGDRREVPLSSRAREILALLPRGKPTCFDLDPAIRDALFRKARRRAQIENLHFHDSRAEAVYRLSRKLSVLELARVIGHRDIRSLMHYYEADADELADRLG